MSLHSTFCTPPLAICKGGAEEAARECIRSVARDNGRYPLSEIAGKEHHPISQRSRLGKTGVAQPGHPHLPQWQCRHDRPPLLHRFLPAPVHRAHRGTLRRRAHRLPRPHRLLSRFGGQPCDTGAIAASPCGRRRRREPHRPLPRAPLDSTVVECAIDWSRRFDHMQQHTGQHVLSAGSKSGSDCTPSASIGAESSTIDLEGGAVEPARCSRPSGAPTTSSLRTVPWRSISSLPLRSTGCAKPRTAKAPCASFPSMGSTAALAAEPTCAPPGRWGHPPPQARQGAADCPCGIPVRRAGGAAGARDYEALSKTAQLFSAPLDEVPAMVAAQLETARAHDKARRQAGTRPRAYQGRELYLAAAPGATACGASRGAS